MKDYFENHLSFLKDKYIIKNFKELVYDVELTDVVGYEINEDVNYIYRHYKEFSLSWFDNSDKYVGEIIFVSYEKLNSEHDDLIETMNECYDVEKDEFDIARDIAAWYPLFKFSNGDAFCLDKRNGNVVLYEHDVFDSGKSIHGQIIAKSIDELFEKWGKIHFVDIYYWDEVCNEEGIDVELVLAQKN